MLGAAIIVIVLVVAIPVGVLVTGGVGAAILGWALRVDAEQRHQGSELLDLNT